MLDLRYALRQLTRSPGFSVVAVVTLVLGMGAATAFFSVLHGVALRQLPYPQADRLVSVHNLWNGRPTNGGRLSRGEFRDYRERQRGFAGLAASDLGRRTLTATRTGEGFADRVKVSRITANLFPLLGVEPVLGRTLRPDDEPGSPIAIISHELWHSHFAGAADILSRTVKLNGTELAIVGVMPARFSYPEPDMGAWVPIDLATIDSSDRSDHYLAAVARLADDASPADARLELQRVARQLQQDGATEYPADPQWSIGLESMRHSQFGHMLLPLGVLMAAAASVLLIACVNVAIMSLLRALRRRREISIRMALGAARHQIMRQLMIEAAVLCVLGAGGGIVVARAGLSLLKAFAPAGIPRLDEVAINLPAALFIGALLVLVTLAVGLAPAAVASRLRGIDETIPSGRASDGRSAARLRDALTVAEIALAASLLMCAGLTARSLQALVNIDLGFVTEQRFSFKTNPTERDYPDAATVARFYDQLIARLESLPGTIATGAISYLPLSGEGQVVSAAPTDATAGRDAEGIPVGWGIVRGDYFETMGVRLLHGRSFTPGDRPGADAVAVVDDVLARKLWTSEDAAIGRRVRFGEGPRAETRTIVGVVHRVAHVGPGRESLPMAFAPQSQVYQRGMYTVVRTAGPPEATLAAARAALAAVDPSVPMYFADTIATRYDQTLALPRFTAGLVGTFSTLALLLAGVGICGVTGYAVGQRKREFGIRLALGAQRAHIGLLVLGRVARLAALGLAIGCALGLGLGSLMTGILFGVAPEDPAAIAAMLAAMAVTALLASLAPLRHAIRVNPTEILRAE